MKIQTDLLEQLEKELGELQVKTYRAESREDLLKTLEALLTASHSQNVALENRALIQELNLEETLQKEGRHLLGFNPKDRKAMLRETDWKLVQTIEAGLGGADYALADTGTLVLFSKNSSGRWISLVPKIHIVLLPVECILSSLDELCFKLDLAGDLSSFGSAITFISGPSRTADIELNIVMGAHGPKELHVVTLLFPINSLGSKGNVQC